MQTKGKLGGKNIQIWHLALFHVWSRDGAFLVNFWIQKITYEKTDQGLKMKE